MSLREDFKNKAALIAEYERRIAEHKLATQALKDVASRVRAIEDIHSIHEGFTVSSNSPRLGEHFLRVTALPVHDEDVTNKYERRDVFCYESAKDSEKG